MTHFDLKETRNSFKKWPLNLWCISNKTVMEVGNLTKAATFKIFLHPGYKKTQLLLFVTVLFNIFMRQALTDDFWGLHKLKLILWSVEYNRSMLSKTNSLLFIDSSKPFR